MKRIIALILLYFGLTHTWAQTDTDSLQQQDLYLIARSYGDSVVLRWAPTSYHIWTLGNKYGYVLERWHEGQEGFEKIAGPIKPYTLDEWKARTDTTDATVTIAAQVLHGKRAVDPTASEGMGRKLMAHDEQNNRYAFALMAADFSAPVAQALALRYEDKNLNKHKHFIYRLYIPYAEEQTDTVKLYVDTDHRYQPSAVHEVQATGKDHVIEVRWNKPLNDQFFSGYYIERSEDGKKFTRLNTRPFQSDESVADGLLHLYNDSVAVNNQRYWYRVTGITSFGDEGLPSTTVDAIAMDRTPPAAPFITTSKEIAGKKVLLEWQTDANEDDHDGFYVMKSDHVSTNFKPISKKLKKSARSFTDTDPSPFKPNYYKVVAVDENGNRSESITAMGLLRDDTPPAQPGGLVGEVDSLGIVSLAWDVVAEEDLKGYRVYRANGTDREFIQITRTPIPGNFYTDTVSLRTLSHKVYYKIAAFDFSYNPSPYSDILELDRPDYYPPVKPVMEPFRVNGDTVQLAWAPSTSNDIATHVLYRKEAGKDWQELASFTDNSHTYSDTNLTLDGRYVYAVEAVDEGGLRSGKSNEARVHYKKVQARKPVAAVEGKFDPDAKSFVLSWQYGEPGQYTFQVFRGETEHELVPYGTVDGHQRMYTDHKLYYNNSGYVYAVRVLYADGTTSNLSAWVSVAFKQ